MNYTQSHEQYDYDEWCQDMDRTFPRTKSKTLRWIQCILSCIVPLAMFGGALALLAFVLVKIAEAFGWV
jgi:hypothetical protein